MSGEEGGVRGGSKKGRPFTVVAVGLLVLFLVIAAVPLFFTPVSVPYDFEGEVIFFGEKGHSVFHNEGIEEEVAVKFAAYLKQVGYFSPEYSGIVQIHATDTGYSVYLSYKKRHWGDAEFIEEVQLLAEDLEEIVLEKPVLLIVVDEDEDGVYRKEIR